MTSSYRPRPLRDITAEFTSASSQLQPGELVKDDFFTLFEAVSALEIMDPKMDSGWIPPIKGDSFEPCFDPSASLDANQTIWIIDHLSSLEITWLEGYPLSQTLFTSLHIDRLLTPDRTKHDTFHKGHTPSDSSQPPEAEGLTHTVLRAYCVALIKCCEIAIQLVQSQTYYEEEDFVTHLFGRELLPLVTPHEALDALQRAISWIENAALPADIAHALLHRCKFRMDLLHNFMGHPRPWEQMLGLLERCKETHRLGKDTADAFSEKVQRQLATSTPPRPMAKVSYLDAHRQWTKLCEDILAAYRLTAEEIAISPACLQRAVWEFTSSRQPGTLARAHMQEMLFSNPEGAGGVPPYDLLFADMVDLVLVGDLLGQPSIFQEKAPNDSKHICGTILQKFMEKAVDEYLNLYRMVCQNRCRTRRTFTQAIAIWDALQREAEDADEELLRNAKWSHRLRYTGRQGPLRVWTRYHTLRLMTWTIQLGFETDIFLPDELGTMYWYVATLTQYRITALRDMKRAITERKTSLHDPSTIAACTSAIDHLNSLIDSAHATHDLASALWKFYHLLTTAPIAIIRPPPRDFATNPQFLYEARWKPYLASSHGYVEDDLPGRDAHANAIDELQQHTGGGGGALCSFESSCATIEDNVKSAKAALARLKKYTPEQAKCVGTEEGWKREIKMLETTGVALLVAVSQLKTFRAARGAGGVDGEGLGSRVRCTFERKYHEWWVIPQLEEKGKMDT